MSMTNKNSSIANGSDVLLNTLSNGQVLTYDSSTTKWRNATPSFSNGSSNVSLGQTIYADTPPTGQTSITADGVTDDAARMQTLLNYVSSTYGGGILQLPAGKTVKCNSGITIPANVRLRTPPSTTLDFSGIGPAVAITSTTNGAFPLEGGTLIGPNIGDQNSFSTIASTGLKLTGNGITIKDVNITRFNRGLDITFSNTFIHLYNNVSFGNCGVCVWADFAGAFGGTAVTNSGERINFNDCVFYNSKTLLTISGAGGECFFSGCSLDYSAVYANISDSHVFYNNCHFESKAISSSSADWGTPGQYLIHMANSARAYFTNVNVIMGGQGVYHMIDTASGPANYGVGFAMYDNCTAYFTPTGGSSTGIQDFSRRLISAGTINATSITIKSFFLSRWNTCKVASVTTDGYTQQNISPYISSINTSDGAVTISFSAITSAPSWIELAN